MTHIKQLTGLLIPTLLVAILSGTAAQAQTIYEWQDDNGERHYSDTPPDDGDVAISGMEVTRTDNEAVRTQLAEKREAQLEAADAASKQAEIDSAGSEKEKRVLEKRQENCTLAKQTADNYSRMRRIYRQTDDGEIEWLDVDEQREKAQEQVDKWCD